MEVVQLSTDSFNRLCRTCLAAADTTVFQIEMEDIPLVEMFEKCTTIQMNENDNLPHKICKNCIDEMVRFYKFRTKCLETQAVLSKVIADEEDRKPNTVLEIKQEEIEICDVDDNRLESGIEQTADMKRVNQSAANQVATDDKKLSINANQSTDKVCYVCNIRFESRKALMLHRGQPGHPRGPKARISCPICSEHWLVTGMKSHVLKKHPHVEIPYKCEVCDEHFNLPGHLERHRAVHMNEKRFQCELCGMAFKSRVTKGFHLLRHQCVDYTCRDCTQQFTTADEYKRHKLGECPKRLSVVAASLGKRTQLECSECEAVFFNQSDLKEHIQLHKMAVETNSEEEIMIVQVIDENHLERGSDDNISKEADCKLNVIKQEEIEIFDVHDNRLESGIEQNAEKLCTRPNASTESIDFESHQALALHSGEAGHPKDDSTTIQCTTIGSKSIATTSMRTYSQQRALECDLCERSFSRPSNLNRHLLLHKDQKNFSCNICGKGFTRREHKTNHMVMHTKNKNYTDRECEQRFNEQCNLWRHKLHDGPKKLTEVASKVIEVEKQEVEEVPTIFEVIDQKNLEEDFFGFSKEEDCKLNLIKQEEIEIFDVDGNPLKSGNEQSSDVEIVNQSTSNKVSTDDKKLSSANASTESICSVSNTGLESQQAVELHSGEPDHPKGDSTNSSKSMTTTLTPHMRTYTQQRAYTCQVCEKTFNHSSNLTRHELTHWNRDDFSCEICGRVFIRKQHKKNHMLMHTTRQFFTCGDCAQRFNDLCALRRHRVHDCPKRVVEVTGIVIEKAEVGEVSTISQVIDENNLDLKGGGDNNISNQVSAKKETLQTTTVCHVCNKEFDTHKELLAHRNAPGHPKIMKTIVPCRICSRPTQVKLMRKHLMSHSAEKSFMCNVCGKTFKYPGKLGRHAKIHTKDGEKPFNCDLCGKGFTQAQTRKEHMRTHAKDGTSKANYYQYQRASRCKDCGKLFRNPRYYAEHVSRNCVPAKKLQGDKPKRRSTILAKNEKPLLCQYCGKRFPNNYAYEQHIRAHNGIKQYLCTVCGKRFAKAAILHRHELSHTGEKPYSCKICKKSFAQSGHVAYHMKLVHSKERPFVCVHCGKGFAVKSNLSAHVRMHTGEKPHICNYCGKGFRHSNNMNKHRISQHGHKHSARTLAITKPSKEDDLV